MEEALRSCVEEQRCDGFQARAFGVGLVDPVDQYLKADRAIKYALLFITLTFAGFLRGAQAPGGTPDPVRAGRPGAGVLLTCCCCRWPSMSASSWPTWPAGACVGLIGFYLCFVLRSVARGLGFSVGLAGLYGLLYGLLSAEDYALLMGSLLLFAVLAAVMVLTRRLDWYGSAAGPPGGTRQGLTTRAAAPAAADFAKHAPVLRVHPLCRPGLLVSGVILIFLLFFGKFGLIEY